MSKKCRHRYQAILEADKMVDEFDGIPFYQKGVIVQCHLCYKQKQMTFKEWEEYKKERNIQL